VQGTSGMMSITGHPGGPPTRLGVPIADIGGGMFAAYAIVAALFDRERSGEGSYVDISMLGGQVAMLTYQAGLYLSTGAIPGQLGNAHPMIAPYDTFPTADGYVNIAVGNESLWERFCTALDLTSLLEDERFANNSGRSTNREALYAMLELRLRTLTTDDVVRLLDTAGVPCGPIRDVGADDG
jgi:crotonobetainyl-CoA:carnitine CoA-transferase CaiB-like acyl-CoA transferase